MNQFALINKILSLLPIYIAGAEAIYTEAKQGAKKKSVVMDSVNLALSGAGQFVSGDLLRIQSAASSMIDNIVTLANTLKVFKTTGGAAPAATN